MATITDQGFPNIPNLVARMTPTGEYRAMAEVLNKSLDIIQDVPFVECNLDQGHQVAYRTGLPSPQWRRLNQGVSPTKSTGAQFVESTGMLEDRAEVDVDMPGDIASWRRSERAAKVEMMSQEFARALFYESAVDNADRVHGLSARYGGTSGYTASNYVLTGTNGGVNCHSIWLINWQPGRVYGIYPKGSHVGLFHKDLGEIDCLDADSKKFRGYADKLQWKFGFAVEDYRYTSRLQWDPDDADMAESGKGLYLLMQKQIGTVFNLAPNARFYMDRTSLNLLNSQLISNTSNALEYVEMGGKRVAIYMGVPIRVTDALTLETAIS